MKTICATVALSVAAGLATQAGAAVIPTVGVYDENGLQANTVDVSATAMTAATFGANVASAFASNTGGVWDMEQAFTGSSNFTSIDLTYGVSQANTLTITSGSTNMQQFLADINQVPLSGTQILGFNAANWTLSFSTPLLEVGLTVLSRNGDRNVNLKATLDNGSVVDLTSPANYLVPAGTTGTADTFFGLTAPTGRTIVSLANSGGAFIRVDDIGFVVIPEPTSLASLTVLALVAGRRRRVG